MPQGGAAGPAEPAREDAPSGRVPPPDTPPHRRSRELQPGRHETALGEYPAASVLKVIESKPIKEIDDQTLILADVGEKAIRQVESSVRDLLGERLPVGQAESLARTLATGTWTHDYPITVAEARALGLPVSTEMPREVYEMMRLYPQTAQRRPSVEYIPVPYGPRQQPAQRQVPARRRETAAD